MSDKKHFYYLPIMDNGSGQCRTDYLTSFLGSFCRDAKREIYAARHGDSHPGRGRNRAAAAFLETECDYMLFIDTDIVFNETHIKMLYAQDDPILCGMYFLKQKDVQPCMATLPGHLTIPALTTIKVARAGTGFMRIHRSVFEKLKETTPVYYNGARMEWDFFASGVINQGTAKAEWLSEDWYFCDKARAAGFDVMMDTRIQVKHQGSILYPMIDDAVRLSVCPENLKSHMEQIWKGEYAITGMPEPKTILDIGGNVGGFSCWANEQWPDAQITAYEPHPDNAALFRWNTRYMGDRCKLHQEGVRDRSGTFMLVEGNNCGEHSVHFSGQGLELPFVSAHRLERAEFVKLDCEGCEPEIVATYDWSGTKAIALEYHSEADMMEIPQRLTEKGFEMVKQFKTGAVRGVMHFLRKEAE